MRHAPHPRLLLVLLAALLLGTLTAGTAAAQAQTGYELTIMGEDGPGKTAGLNCPEEMFLSQTLQFNGSFENTGDIPIDDVSFQASVSSHFQLSDFQTEQGEWSGGGQTAQLFMGTVAPGQLINFSFIMTAVELGQGTLQTLFSTDLGGQGCDILIVELPGVIEIDQYGQTLALVQLVGGPFGSTPVTFLLGGPTEVHVFFEGQAEGIAEDDDNNGLDEVNTQIASLNLSNGTINLRHNPDIPSVGQIEETTNGNPGILNVPPFANGTALSTFDVFFEIDAFGQTFHNQQPLFIESTILTKPPFTRYIHLIPQAPGIQLFNEQGIGTGVFITRAEHYTGFVEIDQLENTTALLQLTGGPFGNTPTPFTLSGPALVNVFFEGPLEGDAEDNDGNGRDEVDTELVQMNLSDGFVTLRTNPLEPSLGQIEELVNQRGGRLDLNPFANGDADSFFDVYFEIEAAGQRFYNNQPLRLETVIREKPPFDRYVHLIPPNGPLQLVNANGTPTGVFIVRAAHHTGYLEVDTFENSSASIGLIHPDGTEEEISLSGPTTVNVFFEGPEEGDVRDDDSDGSDEVATEMVQLELTGSSSLGPVEVRLNPEIPSTGEIRELANNTPGVLDLQPFTDTGVADSFFDVFFEIQVGTQVLHTDQPKRMTALITEKPPAQGDAYENPEIIPLLLPSGNPSGFAIGRTRHVPFPEDKFVEIDFIEETTALVQISGGSFGSAPQALTLRGSSEVHVTFDGENEGDAEDDDGDGLDEVQTELVSLDLSGDGVSLRINPNTPSLGEIEELVNNNPGLLDIDPFAPGDADSFFDVFFEIEVAGQVLHNQQPLFIQAVIGEKPPIARYIHLIPPDAPVELFTAAGQATGIFITKAEHYTGHVEVDHVGDSDGQTTALFQLVGGPIGNVPTPFIVRGPATVHVFFERAEGDAEDDDGDGLDEVDTELVSMNLTDGTIVVTERADLPSPGEIEEKQNNNPGLLDLDPFADGDANSFFDVFFEIEAFGFTLRNEEALRIEAMIGEKPPFERYVHLIPPGGALELVDANGNPTGIFIVRAEHNTGFVEIDDFANTRADIELMKPDGTSEIIPLNGPATVTVFFENDSEGDAEDDDGDGLDEVQTEMVSMDLTGVSSLGPVEVRLRPDEPSVGEIEEQVNNTPGVLDVDPFAPGDADSFFDVFFEIEVGGQVFHTEEPKRMRTTLKEKPPGPGETYEDPQVIPLFDANGNPTGFAIGRSRHVPQGGFEEVDFFEQTTALVQLVGGELGDVPIPFILRGPAEARVEFDGPNEGDADDDDGNGLEEVDSRLTLLDLTDGRARMVLNPVLVSLGQIEEKENNTPGTLDVHPFAPGAADSFFDVFFEIQINGLVLRNGTPFRIASMIRHKPPIARYFHLVPENGPIELEDEAGNPTGIFVVNAEHYTGRMKVERFRQESRTTIELVNSDGSTETIPLSGPSRVHVFYEGPDEGNAHDDDGNGRGEIQTELVALNLTGENSAGELIQMRLRPFDLSPFTRSLGQIEEQENGTPGTLDLGDFGNGGAADSFFDIFVELEVGTGKNAVVYHTEAPKRIEAVITEDPPEEGVAFNNDDMTDLVDDSGQPAGIAIGSIIHEPVALGVEVDPVDDEIPSGYELGANYPNPFQQTTVIPFGLPQPLPVRIEVYDVLGRHVATLVDEPFAAGRHEVTWESPALPAGVYLVRMQAGTVVRTRRITLMR